MVFLFDQFPAERGFSEGREAVLPMGDKCGTLSPKEGDSP